MKSIVIISPYIPWPLQSGGNVGVYYMLLKLCKKVHITFISCYNKKNTRKNLYTLQKRLPNIDFRIYDFKAAENSKYEWAKKITRLINKHVPFTQNATRQSTDILQEVTPDFIQFINDVIAEKKADVAQIEFYDYLPLVCALPDGIKKVFIHHELRYVINEQRWRDDYTSRFLKEYLKVNEIALLNQFDIVAPLTDIDLNKLKSEGVHVPMKTSTLAISDKVPCFQHHKFANRLTFIGGDGHSPNKDGIFWFVKNVLPLIVEENHDISLEIIGNWSEKSKKELLGISNNTKFLGFVESLEEGLKNSIMIVPIRIGSGMRMKILEAASYSVPMVTTTIGVEGLDFKNEEDCIIADNSMDMAKQILNLTKNEMLYQAFSEKAYNIFLNKYSADVLCNIRLSLYE